MINFESGRSKRLHWTVIWLIDKINEWPVKVDGPGSPPSVHFKCRHFHIYWPSVAAFLALSWKYPRINYVWVTKVSRNFTNYHPNYNFCLYHYRNVVAYCYWLLNSVSFYKIAAAWNCLKMLDMFIHYYYWEIFVSWLNPIHGKPNHIWKFVRSTFPVVWIRFPEMGESQQFIPKSYLQHVASDFSS